MVRRERTPLPRPRSYFVVVRCPDCGADRVIFSHSSSVMGCRSCGRELARPLGGKAEILGNIIRRLE